MKIYRLDGTYTENKKDTDFGWHLGQITIDNYKLPSAKIKKEPTSLPDPAKIKIQEAKSVIFTQNSNPIGNMTTSNPSKTQLASLINPCCVESKMLLSVVHYAKYKNLKKQVDNLGDLTENKRLKFLIRKNHDIETDICRAINNYFASEDDNVLSLMMELILTDTQSDLNEIAEPPTRENCCDITDGNGKFPKNATAEILDRFGIGDVINRSLERMCEETSDIHLKISEIRKSFQEDELRVNSLIEEAQQLEKSLRETKFLDNLLHLLNGDLHKIHLEKSPFRIFLNTPSSSNDEPNLIV